MVDTPIWKNDFVIVGASLIIYGHLIWAFWEILVFVEDKEPLKNVSSQNRDFTLGFLSTFWPVTIIGMIIVFISQQIKRLWKT
jgi:hypothetical protein